MKKFLFMPALLALMVSSVSHADVNLARTCFAPNATQYAFADGKDCPADQKGWSKVTPNSAVLATSNGAVTYNGADSLYRLFSTVPPTGQVTVCTDNIVEGVDPADTACKNRVSVTRAQVAVASIPTNVTGIVHLKWAAPTGGDAATGYYIYQGSSPTQLSRLATNLKATDFSYDVPMPIGLFYFAIAAFNDAGEGVKTAALPVEIKKLINTPGTPQQFEVTIIFPGK